MLGLAMAVFFVFTRTLLFGKSFAQEFHFAALFLLWWYVFCGILDIVILAAYITLEAGPLKTSDAVWFVVEIFIRICGACLLVTAVGYNDTPWSTTVQLILGTAMVVATTIPEGINPMTIPDH